MVLAFKKRIYRAARKFPWVLGVTILCGIVCIPLYQLVVETAQPATENWKLLIEKDPSGLLALLPEEMRQEVMPRHTTLFLRLKSTCIVLAGVLVCCTLLGVCLAWVLSAYRLPGKQVFGFLLVMPMAIPSYVMASCYKQLSAGAELASSIYVREKYGAEMMQQYDVVWNYGLAIFVLTVSFYPYVFLAARGAFSTLSPEYQESSRMLGKSSWHTFRKVILPLARPAIVAGMMLVALETLNEYGAMKIIGIETLLTEVFKIRSGTNDLNTAVRVAGCIMLIVFVLLCMEQILRGRRKYHASRSGGMGNRGKPLTLFGMVFIYLLVAGVLAIGFIMPVSELLRLAFHGLQVASVSEFVSPVLDSFQLAGGAALVTLLAALFISYANRQFPVWWMTAMTKVSALGYAIPGAILGIAIITWNGAFMHRYSGGIGAELVMWLFYQSTAGLVIAYGIRFLTVAIGPVDAGLKNIRVCLDEASCMLKRSPGVTFWRVHLPLLRPAMLAALLVLFVDVLKELPLTLILSPFNTETLAVRTYSLFAVQEDYARGAIPALILVVTGILGMSIVSYLLQTQKVSK